MPKIDTSKRPDIDDLADDDIRRLDDGEVRDALYEMSKKIKLCLAYQELLIETLYSAVTSIEEELP